MKNKLVAKVSIHINAPATQVWDALTNPSMIKKWLHGTEAVSDWKVGSSLEFKGEWKGENYLDKGVILQTQKDKLFQYSWLSSFSGLEDIEENYSIITYELFPKNGETELQLTQDNIGTKESVKGSEQNWTAVLNEMKNLLEKS